ncbi:hypothetical protein F5Y16DRAFT_386594 [Xylariaceae sp. FL0255]|nr:hypothetical protein F5Y16DRAFT_386594 [Xylariaceae sp. FL0255]
MDQSTMFMTRATPARQPQKRVITSARKEQNRVAQKAFRERRKEDRLQKAQRMKQARELLCIRELRPYPAPSPENKQVGLSTCQGPEQNFVSSIDLLSETTQTDDAQLQIPSLITFNPTSQLSIPDISDFNSSISEMSNQSSSHCLHIPVHILTPGPAPLPIDSSADDINNRIEDSTTAVVYNMPTTISNTTSLVPSLPSPFFTHLQFAPVTLFTAMTNNALSLGLDLHRLMTPDYISPFYNPNITHSDDPKLLLTHANSLSPDIPVHLRPTLPQILYPHHPYLDLLPYPALRARLVVLSATMPNVFNELEFKKDVWVHAGLMCWRSVDGPPRPWDMRCWEASPWFLNKWRMLVDGESGEMWKQSRKWWGLRCPVS